MKTTCTRTLITGLFLAIVIVSCQKNDLSRTEATTPKAPISGTQLEIVPLADLPDCSTHCISPTGPFVEVSDSKTETSGPNSKTVSYNVYNTATSLVIAVTFTQNKGHASDDISVTALGTTQTIETLASGSVHEFTFALPLGWQACNNKTFAIHQVGQGQPIDISSSYNLYGLCAEKICTTSFSGVKDVCSLEDQDRQATYTFTSQEDLNYFKIQGGLTDFTGGDADVTVSGGSTQDPTQKTPGGSTNRVITVEGSIKACETVTITIKWKSTNSNGVITGNWSVKDANGNEIAPSVAGLTCN